MRATNEARSSSSRKISAPGNSPGGHVVYAVGRVTPDLGKAGDRRKLARRPPARIVSSSHVRGQSPGRVLKQTRPGTVPRTTPRTVHGWGQSPGMSGRGVRKPQGSAVLDLAVPVVDGVVDRGRASERARRRPCCCPGRRRSPSSPSSRASTTEHRLAGAVRHLVGAVRALREADEIARREHSLSPRGREASAFPRARSATPPRDTRSGRGRCCCRVEVVDGEPERAAPSSGPSLAIRA